MNNSRKSRGKEDFFSTGRCCKVFFFLVRKSEEKNKGSKMSKHKFSMKKSVLKKTRRRRKHQGTFLALKKKETDE